MRSPHMRKAQTERFSSRLSAGPSWKHSEPACRFQNSSSPPNPSSSPNSSSSKPNSSSSKSGSTSVSDDPNTKRRIPTAAISPTMMRVCVPMTLNAVR